MLASKEKLEDMKWLENLQSLVMYKLLRDNGFQTPSELQAEIDRVKAKLATHDYAPLEARRQASIRRLGKESAYY